MLAPLSAALLGERSALGSVFSSPSTQPALTLALTLTRTLGLGRAVAPVRT